MLGLATNPIPIKAAMQMLGRDTGELRMPMTPLDAAGEARLRATLGQVRAVVARFAPRASSITRQRRTRRMAARASCRCFSPVTTGRLGTTGLARRALMAPEFLRKTRADGDL